MPTVDNARNRPPGQTNWSKALVRHGADPRVALAGVLGVPAGDIRVRGGAKENLTGVKPRGLAAP